MLQSAKQKALQDEAAGVLARFNATIGGTQPRVTSITRIQNLRLWTKYCLRSRWGRQGRGGCYGWVGEGKRVHRSV